MTKPRKEWNGHGDNEGMMMYVHYPVHDAEVMAPSFTLEQKRVVPLGSVNMERYDCFISRISEAPESGWDRSSGEEGTSGRR